MRQQGAGRFAGAMVAFAASLLALAGSPALAPALAKTTTSAASTTSGTPSTVANGPVDAKVAATLARLVSEGDTQTSFPPPPPREQPPEIPEWLKSLFGWLSGDGSSVVSWVGWSIVALIILFALYLTIPWVRDVIDALIARFRRGSDAGPHGDTIAWQPDHSGAHNLLAEADRLAASGQFAEAVHLLLGHSLTDIANRRPGLLKPALTARAIALMDELPAPARSAFRRIAATVERSLWARQPIDQNAWADARAAYEDFAFGPHWRGQMMAGAA